MIKGHEADLVVLGGPDDLGVGDDGDEAVDVGAEVELDHVAVLEEGVGLARQRAEVADAVVHAHAAREGDA